MRPTYFASFLLGADANGKPPLVHEAFEEIAEWIFGNPHRPLARPENWPSSDSEAITFPNGERIQLLTVHGENDFQTAAVRFEHSDDQQRIWRTDCVLTQIADPDPAVRFAVTVAAGSSGEGLFPVTSPSSRPRIVLEMIRKFGGRERYSLKATIVQIKSDEAPRFVEFLLDQERAVPVVFVSRRNRDNDLLCDPFLLADRLVGIAYVCVADDVQLSWRLAGHIDNELNAYDGTVRVYWPRMRLDDPPYRHRWWTRQRLYLLATTGRSLANELLKLIATASVTRRISGLVRWEDVEREIARHSIQKIQGTGAVPTAVSEDWLRQYDLDLAELDSARQALAEAEDRLLVKDGEIQQWKGMYLHLLRHGSADAVESFDDETPFEDSEGAIATAERDFKDRLVFIDQRVEKSVSQFEEPELLYAALKWLATTYWNAKTGTVRCPDLDKSCRETCQFHYAGHQSAITMGMFASDYEVNYHGSKIKLEEHIGFGTSPEPRHTIRIAFFFDGAMRKTVVGYVGQHQATRKSN